MNKVSQPTVLMIDQIIAQTIILMTFKMKRELYTVKHFSLKLLIESKENVIPVFESTNNI